MAVGFRGKRQKQFNKNRMLGQRLVGFAGLRALMDELYKQKMTPLDARKWVRSNVGVYIPGGSRCNVKGTYVRNPKIAAQVNAMHDKWEAARHARPV